MTTYAKHARPPRVAIAWATKEAIFCEIPVQGGGPPYVCKYPRTAAGLASAFGILVQHESEAKPLEGRQTDHPKVVRAKPVNGHAPSVVAMDLVRKMRLKA